MNRKNEELKNLIPCFLELIKTFQGEGKHFRIEDLAKELGVEVETLKKLADLSVEEGFLASRENLKITEEGDKLIEAHREKYVHDKYAHGNSLLGRISRFLERKNSDMRFHWRSRHGIEDDAIKSFRSNIRNLKGRIEETVPLSWLSEGEEAVVTYLLGGYGMVKRLAEMGLIPGTKIKVLRRGLFRGPVQVMVRGSCLALGHGVASRVFVKPFRGKTT